MSDLIVNPRKSEPQKDLHIYVSPRVYNVVDKLMVDLKKTKTDYVGELIKSDLKRRGLL